MHLGKPTAWSQTMPQTDSFAFSPVIECGQQALRQVGTFPETYGFVTYVDPYLDFLAVDAVASDGTVASWTGTHRQYADMWEPFLIKGAT